MNAPCPHCGRPDAPMEDGRIDRHRRADWDREAGVSNELCMASFTRPRIGEPCAHLVPSEHCTGSPA
jgi:hypothetical protein